MFIPSKDFRQEETQTAPLNASLTFYIGDVVALIGSGSTIYENVLDNQTNNVQGAKYPVGVLVGFTNAKGQVIGQGANPSGPIVSQNGPNYITTAADNLTNTATNYYGVFVPITPVMSFIGDLSAVAGTTNYSKYFGTYFELNDCRTILESSAVASDNIQSTSQILSLGLVEDENQPVVAGAISRTKIYCKIIKNAWTRQA